MGEGYLPWMGVGVPTLDRGGVPTLDRRRGYLSWTGEGVPTLDERGGTYLGQGGYPGGGGTYPGQVMPRVGRFLQLPARFSSFKGECHAPMTFYF